uniref:Uncharacterized protein n=1 Tax=Anopheles epiroticus TaxID=199890 RepID=A0A182PA44_9DIPT
MLAESGPIATELHLPYSESSTVPCSTASEPPIISRPLSPRKFFERLYGHLERDDRTTGNGSANRDGVRVPSDRNECLTPKASDAFALLETHHHSSDSQKSVSVNSSISSASPRSSLAVDIEEDSSLDASISSSPRLQSGHNRQPAPTYHPHHYCPSSSGSDYPAPTPSGVLPVPAQQNADPALVGGLQRQPGMATVSTFFSSSGGYGPPTFRPFFGIAHDGAQLPAGLSAFLDLPKPL